MRVVITGGAGFIGSHLAEALLTSGHEVVAVDDLSTGSPDNVASFRNHPGFELIIGSVNDEALITPLVQSADVVYHLAAAVGVRLVCEEPIRTIETNVNGTSVVLRAALPTRTRVVVASTSEVYGKGVVLPFREDADLVLGQPTKTRWGYATSKLIDEFLALGYHQQHKLPVTVVRFFNCVGPRQSSRYGMVLPNFVQAALANEPMTIHGDGRQTRSFTWVGDIVNALILMANEPLTYGEVLNVGNDQEVSIAELATRVREALGGTSQLRFVSHAAVFGANFEDMNRRVPDISKIARILGWRPTVSLHEIISRTAKYWEKQMVAA
jgi:UDP-glucose 4-epimerase